MKNLLIALLLLLIGCTTPSYPNIDRPSTNISDEDKYIIDYIDQRLSQEYYWLDEVCERSHTFNRNQAWSKYLPNVLGSLQTNVDDGYLNNQNQRVLYSYIRNTNSATRSQSEVIGFGISLYYVIVSFEDGSLGFVIDYIYADSPAYKAGLRRGDIILSIEGNSITRDNYATLFNTIQKNTAQTLRLELRRQVYESEQDASLAAMLTAASYYENPVLYSDVITVDDSNIRIGYLVYSAFDNDFDEELIAALRALAAEGVDRMILDLRVNAGGAVDSATKLGSMLLGDSYAGSLLCELRRNPANKINNKPSYRYLESVGDALNIDQLTVICSEYTASASELLVTGLRGLDVPVTLVGSQTQGKNCGMDVSFRIIGNKHLEFAPITFMCYNAKGFGDYGDGLAVDIDLCNGNSYDITDEYYPLPRCEWGDMEHDIALICSVADITGGKVSGGAESRCCAPIHLDKFHSLTPPEGGTLLYEE